MKSAQPSKGLGDTIAKVTSAVGIKPCGGCEKRRQALNQMFPYGGAMQVSAAADETIVEQAATKCAVCGAEKHSGAPFCPKCCARLDPKMLAAMERWIKGWTPESVKQGYLAAKAWLTAECVNS